MYFSHTTAVGQFPDIPALICPIITISIIIPIITEVIYNSLNKVERRSVASISMIINIICGAARWDIEFIWRVITAIITERGTIREPYIEKIKDLFGQQGVI